MENKEIEVRFLEINKNVLIGKLIELGAKDRGEAMLEEVIVYDAEMKWPDERRFVRLRKNGDTTLLSYKENKGQTVDSTIEVEFGVANFEKAQLFFEKIGLVCFRRQQKKRHTFTLGEVTIDIDTWPRIPTYVELEGPSEKALKDMATDLGFDWRDAVTKDARWVIENKYKIPVSTMRWFTFERFE